MMWIRIALGTLFTGFLVSAAWPAAGQTNATINFAGNWTQAVSGQLKAGGGVTLTYDPARAQIRHTHNGFPAWGIDGFVKFLPSAAVVQSPVIQFQTYNGMTTNNPLPKPWTLAIPSDTRQLEIWFRNYTGADRPDERWDSNSGRNYKFDVAAGSSVPSGPRVIRWAGNWGGSFTRECVHKDGLPQPIVVDSYMRERACMFVDAEVYVPGLTDAGAEPQAIQAQVQYKKTTSGALKTVALSYVGKAGNNYRYRWMLPREDMTRVYWNTIYFKFRFSLNGTTWFKIGKADGPSGGDYRTVKRDPSWCNTGWPGCR
jgi:hypothetical protein